MAEFLSDEWITALDTAARAVRVADDLELVIQQVVPDGAASGEVAYRVEATRGAVRVRPGRAAAPDVTFTQDRATAEAIHRGTLSAQAAFIDGRLRLGGDLRSVIDRAGALVALDDVFAATRA